MIVLWHRGDIILNAQEGLVLFLHECGCRCWCIPHYTVISLIYPTHNHSISSSLLINYPFPQTSSNNPAQLPDRTHNTKSHHESEQSNQNLIPPYPRNHLHIPPMPTSYLHIPKEPITITIFSFFNQHIGTSGALITTSSIKGIVELMSK